MNQGRAPLLLMKISEELIIVSLIHGISDPGRCVADRVLLLIHAHRKLQSLAIEIAVIARLQVNMALETHDLSCLCISHLLLDFLSLLKVSRCLEGPLRRGLSAREQFLHPDILIAREVEIPRLGVALFWCFVAVAIDLL